MNLSGSPLDFLWAFFGGVLISFTPCVYPLIPVSASFIGTNSVGSKFKGFALSLSYATGVAITYSFLGLLAVLTGKIFGQISSHPVTHIASGVFMVIFGLFMLDIIRLPLVNFLRSPKPNKYNYLSAFIFGLGSGFIISPCTAPVLGTILLYLATKNNLLYGSLLLLSFSYGMSVILILVGTFSSILLNLPKSGNWLNFTKRLAAFIVIGMGVYFIISGIRRI